MIEDDLGPHGALSVMQKVFSERGIRWWADQGTLLGLVRDGRLMEGDTDIDVTIWFRDVAQQRREIIQELRCQGLEVSESYLYGITLTGPKGIRPVNISYQLEDRGYAAKFFYHPRLRLNFSRKLRSFLTYLCQKLDGTAPEGESATGLPALIYQIIPHHWKNLCAGYLNLMFFSLNPLLLGYSELRHFQGAEFWKVGTLEIPIPVEAEMYLAHKYGADWRVPQKNWRYWVDDGALRLGSPTMSREIRVFLLRRAPYVGPRE